MPKNHFLNGFLAGLMFGTMFSILALGFVKVDPQTANLGRYLLLANFICSWGLTAYHAVKRKKIISNNFEGLIAGCGFAAQTIVWIVNGIHYP